MAVTAPVDADPRKGPLTRGLSFRKLLPYLLGSGVLVSIGTAVIFNLLLQTLHNPLNDVGYWEKLPNQEWVNAYSSWQGTHFDYTIGSGISILSAMAFAAAFAISFFPRAALVISFGLLNVIYAWTAHVFMAVSFGTGQTVIDAISVQNFFFWDLVNLRYGSNTLIVADVESIAMLATVVVLTFLLSFRNGRKKAILRAFQILAVCCMILGLEILVFDGSEINLHVTQIQASFGVAAWFTNADLLYTGLGLFVASTFVLYFPRLFAWRRAQDKLLSENSNR